ncbi:GNAT family N-acetyltransferase [Plantactinospora sp. S1510]|uniref:GNAT family N-acetyltransferase n=1 Tax=Plantactinospora alkalitolerans TaxID=2789879 RepID=A0ABS0H4K0_9ACTN|nr:GNAT family N-acetyltransferase [Plantactinospora alkalitolerans]MBF9133390.1 GNAT family N-acetyltransferase [Plantactinospora alkalitolerans]
MGIRFVLDPPLTAGLRDEIVSLWTAVTNAGGAVGFVGPVGEEDVRPLASASLREASDGPDHLLVGYRDDDLVALLFLTDNRFHLKAHWCVLKRVMVHPDRQGHGYGQALLREAEKLARQAGWEALHLTVRDGRGVEEFYRRLGYREVGRLPGALRVGPGDDRDEIHMWLPLV